MSPYGDFLGIQIGELAAGRAVCSMTLMDHHLNNGGRVHGGVLTLLRILPPAQRSGHCVLRGKLRLPPISILHSFARRWVIRWWRPPR